MDILMGVFRAIENDQKDCKCINSQEPEKREKSEPKLIMMILVMRKQKSAKRVNKKSNEVEYFV